MEKQHLLNEQIKASRVMLLGIDGEKLGEVSIKEALAQAEEQELDLMQVGQNKDLAICKIINYESWLYHENKKKHRQEVSNKSQEVKSMQFRPGIGENDFNLKIKKIESFLVDNHKVKISIRLKSREGAMKEINDSFIQKISDAIVDTGAIDGKISYSFKEINFIIKPEKKSTPKVKSPAI